MLFQMHVHIVPLLRIFLFIICKILTNGVFGPKKPKNVHENAAHDFDKKVHSLPDQVRIIRHTLSETKIAE